jgi:hypothetical protein
MVDNDPNAVLNRKRLLIESGSMQLNIQRMELRLMEIEAEKDKVNENIVSSNKRIEELAAQIKLTGAN